MYEIMVVDDEPAIVEILYKYLTLNKYKVFSASNGKEALDLLRRRDKIDLIILDEKMPVMSGKSFLAELRKKKFDMPVIILTGSLQLGQIKSLDKSLFQEIFIKPVRLGELLKTLKKYLPGKDKL